MTLGEVLRSLAKQRGIGAYQLAKALDVYHTTVYAWWKDQYRPSGEKLVQYAALVGVTPADIQRAAGIAAERAVIADYVLAIFARIAAGEEPDTAFLAVLGVSVPEERRAVLTAASERLKAYLGEAAGKEWDRLEPAEREAVLAELRAELLRGPAGAPASPAPLPPVPPDR